MNGKPHSHLIASYVHFDFKKTSQYDLEASKCCSSIFLYLWCKEYGLTAQIGQELSQIEVMTSDDVYNLDDTKVDQLQLSKTETRLLKSSLMLYKRRPEIVNNIIANKTAPIQARVDGKYERQYNI